MTIPSLETTIDPIKERSLANLEADKAAVRALAQAALNVELFTVPLYMSSLYSLYGTHEINAKGITYYKGRTWPGMATSAKPDTPNEKAFNTVFSVFIQEMLHMQLAANLATAVGITPTFNSPALQNKNYGWVCYGPDKSVIPHIIDLTHTSTYKNVKVNIESLNENNINLFCAIEQPEDIARKEVKAGEYFPSVPFKNWTKDSTEMDLPMFGTIGWMYECYARYISIEYTDGETLWEKMYDKTSIQRDLFNAIGSGHPMREFPALPTTLDASKSALENFNIAIDMMSGITDQGEGNSIAIARYKRNAPVMLMDVQEKNRPSDEALKADYPSYNASGGQVDSADAEARYPNSKPTHYERFIEVKSYLNKVVTWEQKHADPSFKWTASMLITGEYDASTAPKNIPTPDEVADALNKLKADSSMQAEISKVSVGAIAGVTTVLNTYWEDASTEFPYPSMSGSGDRVSICWAIYGQAPDLSAGMEQRQADSLYHACQAINIFGNDSSDSCASKEVFHTCRGSNSCKAEGGCGFVQLDTGGGSCGAMRVAAPMLKKGGHFHAAAANSGDDLYSSPADNKCATYGGCAVPISASQLFPHGGTMKLYDYLGDTHHSTQVGEMTFELGDGVYETAWKAYSEVLKKRDPSQDPGEAPSPSLLRIAFPPST